MTGTRPLTPAQALQNSAFLDALRLTGNSHEAARTLGVNRKRDPQFDRAVTQAIARGRVALEMVILRRAGLAIERERLRAEE